MRFEVAYYALKPDIKVIAPWREWDLNSRTKVRGEGCRGGGTAAAGQGRPGCGLVRMALVA